ncbi:hypothetical protein [Chryseobacterium vrystaatense]|uniref:Uncharacterized protein n=1 Tax=Chryseobacterium vrystaatense TaxID=307480 RepID=A0ABR4UGC1_9FLAO|nr:hypothetical protein [Chryseobacterium vrystaatense]KFF23565.1 hypothetical protein IW16_25285 [Chryseobacterium vrystaatense]
MNKKANIKFIPVSLFAFGLFSLIAPYFNAFSVVKRSQQKQLVMLLDKNKFSKKISDVVVDDIADKFEFLAKRKQKNFSLNLVDAKTRDLLPEDFNQRHSWSINNSIRNAFTYVDKIPYASNSERLVLESKTKGIQIDDYQYLINFNSYNQEAGEFNGDTFNFDNQLINNSETLKNILNSKVEVEAIPAINRLFEDHKRKNGTLQLKEISVEDNLGKYHIKIVFPSISNEKISNNQQYNIYYESAALLIKEK